MAGEPLGGSALRRHPTSSMSTAPSANASVHAATGSIGLRYSHEGKRVENTTTHTDQRLRPSPAANRPLCDARHLKDDQ